jgi:octaprenyl-diphosphate synthase
LPINETTTLSNSDSNAQQLVNGLIGPDMLAVDRIIAQRLSSGVPLVGEVAQHIILAGGKRLRPVLLLLMAGALDYRGSHQHTLAAVIEFIHTATLLHDDVVDDSKLRRSKPTANALFGNPASVLVGDFLYSRAFQMMVECQNMRILDIVADATNVIAEGEVMQLMNMHDASLDEPGYLSVIRSKTAKLFEASTRLPAVLAACPPEIEQACADYGQALGTAFQVIDDVLDYDGDAALMGKNLGDDLREGKATLPLIVAMKRGSPEECALIKHAIEHGEVDALQTIATIVRNTGAMQATREAASAQAQLALNALNVLPASNYKTALAKLAEQLLERQS